MKNRAGKLIGILLLVMGLFLAAGCGSKAGESEAQETESQQERVDVYKRQIIFSYRCPPPLWMII